MEYLLPDRSIRLEKIHRWVFELTNDSYLHWFQTRLTHRILAANPLLFKINISNTCMCTFCKSDNETLLHLFWECSVI